MLLGVEHEVKPREEHLEALVARYPDVNAEVIVKEDTQREGFMFTNEAINFGITSLSHYFGAQGAGFEYTNTS